MWAPMHHAAMKAWAPARAELGIRTILNLLGPLANPAGVKRQVVGVFNAALDRAHRRSPEEPRLGACLGRARRRRPR